MKKVFIFIALMVTGGFVSAGIVCDEGYNKYGRYSLSLNCRKVDGQTSIKTGYSSLDDELKGQIKSISKDPGTGTIYVERYGEGTTGYSVMATDKDGNPTRYEPTTHY